MSTIKDWFELVKYVMANIAMWHVCAVLGGASFLASLGIEVNEYRLGVSEVMADKAFWAGLVLIAMAIFLLWYKRVKESAGRCEHKKTNPGG